MKVPLGYKVFKSDGRIGWQFQCPKGFNYYNFSSEADAIETAILHFKGLW